MDFANTDIQVVHFLFAGYSRIRCTVKLFFVVFFFFVCFFLMYTRSKRGNNATMKKKILFSFLWFHRKSDLRLSRVVLAFWEQIPWFGHLGDFAHSSVSPWFRRFRDLWREITVSLAFIAPLYLAPPLFHEIMNWWYEWFFERNCRKFIGNKIFWQKPHENEIQYNKIFFFLMICWFQLEMNCQKCKYHKTLLYH